MPRVAILHHPLQSPSDYILGRIAERWQAWGIEVIHLCDPAEHQDADLAIVHVDLTHVPAHYYSWARRFPRAINGHPMDVSKRAISSQLVAQGDGYEGPVLVKTDLNYAGRPEREVARRALRRTASLGARLLTAVTRRRAWMRITSRLDPQHYPIYATPADVPSQIWSDPELVVERFLPEREGEAYCLRKHFYLGSRVVSWRALGTRPIVKARSITSREQIPASAQINDWRQALGLEFGKVDYTEPAGVPVILDANPTPGCGPGPLRAGLPPLVEPLASGIHDWLGAGSDG